MFVESLEGRTFLSGSAINLQVKIDRLEVKADLLKFRSDLASTTATLLGDLQTLKTDGLKNYQRSCRCTRRSVLMSPRCTWCCTPTILQRRPTF